jgi:hypothetical protein
VARLRSDATVLFANQSFLPTAFFNALSWKIAVSWSTRAAPSSTTAPLNCLRHLVEVSRGLSRYRKYTLGPRFARWGVSVWL